MVEGRRDYTADEVEAARSVLVELGHILAEYWGGMVVVGGWVPYFTVPQERTPHEGTKDVDIALNPRQMNQDGYNTIGEILMQSLYQQDTKKAFRYYRTVSINGHPVSVMVDFLTGESAEEGQNGRLYEIQEVMASALHGCDVAFLDPVEREFVGPYPGGGTDKVTVRVASLPAFLVMKGLALHNRGGDDGRKDAYDIYYCIKNYPGSREELSERFQPYLQNPLVREGLTKIADKFASIDHIGPRFIADRADGEAESTLLQRDAYEQVNALLNLLSL